MPEDGTARGADTVDAMGVLFETHPVFVEHLAGPSHPERPARLDAVVAGIERAGLVEAVTAVAPRAASVDELRLAHTAEHIERLRAWCAAGGGRLDIDTGASPASWDAALHAAGAGLDAVERLRGGSAEAAFCAVRPPGHHATAGRAMGFCLFNNVAVTAASLAAEGERVVIVDWDAHHGNGTESIFYDDSRVLYVSLHEYGVGVYPGTGRLSDIGVGEGRGTTLNLPLPPGTALDAYLAAFDDVIEPVVGRFEPTWLLISAGFDAHRADPLADLRLTAGDYATLTGRTLELAPPGRRIAFLEGGYDLDALADSVGAFLAAMAGQDWRPEPPSEPAGLGFDVIERAGRLHEVG